MKSGRSLVNLAQELERQLATKQDLVVPTSLLRCHTDEGGSCRMMIDAKDGVGEYGITNLARRQLAEKLKIPFAYFERMRSEQPALLDRNVNTWLQTDHDRRMIRTLSVQPLVYRLVCRNGLIASDRALRKTSRITTGRRSSKRWAAS